MKKVWNDASVEELDLAKTEFGGLNVDNIDFVYMTTDQDGKKQGWVSLGS